MPHHTIHDPGMRPGPKSNQGLLDWRMSACIQWLIFTIMMITVGVEHPLSKFKLYWDRLTLLLLQKADYWDENDRDSKQRSE